MRYEDLVGRKYGRLMVVAQAGSVHGSRLWEVACDCGRKTVVQGGNLKNGHTTSCGCWQKESASINGFKHGEIRSREYRAWKAMKDRCSRTDGQAHKNYKGRGIVVCKRWQSNFSIFLADMGRCPQGLTLDRKNNDKGYGPKNCRWATWSDQAKNRRPRNQNKNGQYTSRKETSP